MLKSVLGRAGRAVGIFFLRVTLRVSYLILALIITRVLAALIYMPLEDWKFWEGWWWGEVASLTIGYGDLAPKTLAGRLIATPFHYFWVLYITLALGAHVIAFVFRNLHEFTHKEQEWLFMLVGRAYDWSAWSVVALQKIAAERGVQLDPPPHVHHDGTLLKREEQAPDIEDGNVTEELEKIFA